MREYNLLEGYPPPKFPRYVSNDLRKISNRIIAINRDKEFFDGNRNNGYGGFSYDGRWKNLALKIIDEYNLSNGSNFLHINSEKGFLLYDLHSLNSRINLFGLESSAYAKENTLKEVYNNIKIGDYLNLDYPDNHFDFVLAIGVVYSFNLKDAIKSILEIQRVTKKNSFLTLASYENEKDYFLFKKWTLLGNTILKKKEWREVLDYCNFTGDYFFTNASSLHLKEKN